MCHSRVTRPPIREIHYFDLRYWRGGQWYRKQFRRPSGCWSGESSPYYLYHPRVPARVASDLPGIRIIVLLRDPIERAWSQHQMNRRTGREALGFLDALEAEQDRTTGIRPPSRRQRCLAHRDHSYVARGDYVRQLDRWFAAVEPRSVLLIRSTDLFHQPTGVHQRVLTHIGLPDEPLPTAHRNRGPTPLPEAMRAAAVGYFWYTEDELRQRYRIDYG
jgi:hypothetical protein